MTAESFQDMKLLQSLRDEIKLKAHLATMDLKSEWERLEPQVERALSSAQIVSEEVIGDLKKRMTELRRRLVH
jgi:transposase